MASAPIYLDNHSTTQVDPRVVEAMTPYFTRTFGNPSSTHLFGREAKAAVDDARSSIASNIGASDREIVFTSGATESNNMVIRGIADRLNLRGKHIVSVATEHKAVLDPLKRLSRRGFEVTLLPVEPHPHPHSGALRLDDLRKAIRDDTVLVSVMWANNEVGVIHPIQDVATICHERGVPLHCDATQAIGKIPIDVQTAPIDFMSFSAHKIYGPKGVGALYVRRRATGGRLLPLLEGGGQENGLRSGTLNTPGIVGFARALELSVGSLSDEGPRITHLRNELWRELREHVPDIELLGPSFDLGDKWRLPGNLNVHIPRVDGEALLMSTQDVAVSSGAACTSTNPEPSHVLLALGLNSDQAKASLRFGVGRFNTLSDVKSAAERIASAVSRLRSFLDAKDER